MQGFVSAALLIAMLVLAAVAWRARRRRGGRVGPGAAGAVYDLLNEDKRAALQIVVEERTAYRDPEDRDGNLPELESAPDGRRGGAD
jgi:hypothetical protein